MNKGFLNNTSYVGDARMTEVTANDVGINVDVDAHKLSRGSSVNPVYSTTDTVVTDNGFENGDEETGEDASQMPNANGFVNNDSSPISHTQPETVHNREHSVSETQTELVNNNIGQKLENQSEDQGDEFD
ncbi:Breast carcinoma amplified sequence 3 [Artemisia annua]|uniref:Breast carcinoma amplified sequence 3 n=1 Tax=Artemisia annua TaxID=35608 RepID=A0A2U1L729_ARTAN|nr:Breast carcinoma amplified sequence 3 [Artemisia annua]